MLSIASQRPTHSNATDKHAGRGQAPKAARATRSQGNDGLRDSTRAGMPNNSLPSKRRSVDGPVGNSREPAEADFVAWFLNPTKADQEVTRKAAKAKSERPEWWAAMARAVFGAKTAKAQALIMPQACALQARVIGVKKAGKTWLTVDGTFYL